MGHKVIRVTRIARRRQQPPFHRLYNSARGYLGEYVCEGATVAFALWGGSDDGAVLHHCPFQNCP